MDLRSTIERDRLNPRSKPRISDCHFLIVGRLQINGILRTLWLHLMLCIRRNRDLNGAASIIQQLRVVASGQDRLEDKLVNVILTTPLCVLSQRLPRKICFVIEISVSKLEKSWRKIKRRLLANILMKAIRAQNLSSLPGQDVIKDFGRLTGCSSVVNKIEQKKLE